MRPAVAPLALVLASVALLFPLRAAAHGLHGHVHVTGWAIDSLPEGELRTLLSDPEMRGAALMGAAFPDSGYAATDDALEPGARAYGEHAHWEPFVEDFITQLRATHGPTYETREEQLLVAFLLGCASHGLQDELFDSTFLFEVEQRDGAGQEATDPGTDGFLVQDGYFWMVPSDYVPVDELLPLFADLSEDVDAEVIAHGVGNVRVYVNALIGPSIAEANGEMYRPLIPWAADHYLDAGVPGSLRAEILPTARYMEAIWARLHNRFDEAGLVIHAWPDPPRRLREADASSVASWVTLILGKGVMNGAATGALTDDVDAAHPFTFAFTRFTGEGSSRIVRFQPNADLVPGAFYTATLEAGAVLVDGTTTTGAHAHRFQVDCADASLCPPLGALDDPAIDPPPPPPPPDADTPDAAVPDARVDATVDSGAPPAMTDDGCACAAPGRPSATLAWLGLLGAGWVGARGRRRQTPSAAGPSEVAS
jgi:MYXO-CTERM domain-containing protein